MFVNDLCLDVHGEIFGFLEANDQAKLRRTSKYFCTVFNHAFQRSYVAAAIHEGYVDKLDAMHEDGDDGHPLLRVAPVDPKALFWNPTMEMHRSEKDEDATLFVNVRLELGKGTTELGDSFLRGTSFKTVHLFATERLTMIHNFFLANAQLQTFTMSTSCPLLVAIGDCWFSNCKRLASFDLSGCCALERVGREWLWECTALKSASFKGCCRLKEVGPWWLYRAKSLLCVDLSDLGQLAVVEANWLYDCQSLCSVDFRSCCSLRKVGKGWMMNCVSLKTINLEGVLSLDHVGDDFLNPRGFPSMWKTNVDAIFVSRDQPLPEPIRAMKSKFVHR